MEFSEKFIKKFIEDTFKLNDISTRSWIKTIYWFCTDSKERISQRLDLFLKKQIDNPNEELVEVADSLRKGTKNFDDVIINVIRYVKNRCVYLSDEKNFGKVDYWADAYETWKLKRDDCDGQNALIYVLASLVGMPCLNLWCVLGDTKLGYHYWNIYFSPKTGKWYPIDSTFYPDLKSFSEGRLLFKIDNSRYTRIDFIFNEKSIYKST